MGRRVNDEGERDDGDRQLVGERRHCHSIVCATASNPSLSMGGHMDVWPKAAEEDGWWTGRSRGEIAEPIGQGAALVFALWLVFRYRPAAFFQPFYLLFIPVIWVALKHGLPAAAFGTFLMNAGIILQAQSEGHSLEGAPRLQLMALTLGLSGLFVGAEVSERKRAEVELEERAAAGRVCRRRRGPTDAEQGAAAGIAAVRGNNPRLPGSQRGYGMLDQSSNARIRSRGKHRTDGRAAAERDLGFRLSETDGGDVGAIAAWSERRISRSTLRTQRGGDTGCRWPGTVWRRWRH